MSEIIVLTRDQYFSDLHQAATAAAKLVLAHFTTTNRKELYTRAEIAKLLGKSKATIKNMIDTQRLSTTADGMYIPVSEIERYLNEK